MGIVTGSAHVGEDDAQCVGSRCISLYRSPPNGDHRQPVIILVENDVSIPFVGRGGVVARDALPRSVQDCARSLLAESAQGRRNTRRESEKRKGRSLQGVLYNLTALV